MERYLYTDGSCRGNPGPGGFGVIEFLTKADSIDTNLEEVIIGNYWRGDKENTTNNRMEMIAILTSFIYAAAHPEDHFTIYTDSSYCANMINCWIRTWAVNNWKNSKGKDVENKDLVLSLWQYVQEPFFNVSVVHIKGHDGIIGNELADRLATNDKKGFEKILEDYKIELKEKHKPWEICTTNIQ